MKRFVVKRRGSLMPTVTINKPKNNYDVQMKEFNNFLKNNIEFIKQVVPMNPTLTKNDEWRTGDYSEYDKMRKNIK